MTKEEYNHIESSQIQHFNLLEHEQRRVNIGQIAAIELSDKVNCEITKDGDQWCCIWGKGLQVEVAGFGDTPLGAISAWATKFGML